MDWCYIRDTPQGVKKEPFMYLPFFLESAIIKYNLLSHWSAYRCCITLDYIQLL